ncbi:MAG: hypothetical protein ACE5EG_13205 [Thermoanaerobaculia bacterium]
MRSALTAAGVLLALVAPAPAEPALAPTDRVLLAETFRLASELGEEIWPGWGVAPWEVLLVGEEHEYLVNSPRRPEGFADLGRDELIDGNVLVRARTVPANLRATFPILGGPPVVVVGRPEATGLDPTAWLAVVLHEHFHQLQMSDTAYYADVEALALAGDDDSGQWMLDFPFPYDDPEVEARFAGLCTAIRAVLAGQVPAVWVAEAMSSLAVVLPDDAYRYLGFQLWQEGVARYVQYRAARLAGERFEPSPELVALPGYRPFSEVAAELEREILSELAEPRLAERRRVAFYAAGAGLAMLLEKQSPGWRGGYMKRKFALEGLLP